MKTHFIHLLFVLLTSSSAFSQHYKSSHRVNHLRSRRSLALETIYQWNLLDFGFPSVSDRNQALANGNLVPENAVPIDVAPHYISNDRTRVFVTIPRFGTGIPYTLATVSNNSVKTLQPYPQYNWHSSHGSDCDGITSAFRVAITPCNQMWVIDSGIINGVQHCAPQLLLFDLNTDRLVHRYRFTENVYTPRASLFITPVIRVNDPPPNGRCQRTTVYVADVNFHGLVVYDQAQNAAWRVEHSSMYPDPSYGDHTIADESFKLMDGIFSLSVFGPHLYYHALAGRHQYKVPLSILDDRSAFEANIESHADEFIKIGERNTECGAEAVDTKGNIFCVNFDPISLRFWNVVTPYKNKYLHELSNDRDLLQFVSGMKVIKNHRGKEELWMLSNRFQKISTGTLNSNEPNFRILRRSLGDIDNINGFSPGQSGDLHKTLVFN